MLYSQLYEPFEGWYLRAFNQARALAGAGCGVKVLAWDRTRELPAAETREGVQIERIGIRAPRGRGPLNGLNLARFYRAAVSRMLKTDFDVVHCFNVDTMLPGLTAARLRGKPAVLDLCEPDYYRGFWKKRWEWLLAAVDRVERVCSRRFDHVFVHNTYQMEKFESYGVRRMTQVGSYPNRSMLIPAVPASNGATVVVGRLGSAYANNGFEEIVAAMRLLKERAAARGEAERYRLFLAGKVFDAYREQFDSLIASLGDSVTVRGAYNIDELGELYANIHISLLIYGKSRFGNVTPTKLFESMARGVPVIANDVGDMKDIVEGMGCGVIVDESDPQSICEGIERLGNDEAVRRAAAEEGLRLVHDRFSWEANCDRFLAAYESLGCK